MIADLNTGIGSSWSERHLQQATKMRSANLSFHEIGRALNRSADAVAAALDGLKPSERTILKDSEFGYLIGNPRVVIDRGKDGATAFVADAPWGWSLTSAEFADPASPSIERFAQRQLARIRLEAKRELERRERKREARRRQAEGGDL